MPAPPLPALPNLSLLKHMKMLGMKAFFSTLNTCSWLVGPARSLSQRLVQNALVPAPLCDSASPLSAGAAGKKSKNKALVFESSHPYENSLDRYWDVSIPGAKRLTVKFTEECVTETSCDYLRFYIDSSRCAYVPGGDLIHGSSGASGVWPGAGGRPPLVIEGSSFHAYFHTDGGKSTRTHTHNVQTTHLHT